MVKQLFGLIMLIRDGSNMDFFNRLPPALLPVLGPLDKASNMELSQSNLFECLKVARSCYMETSQMHGLRMFKGLTVPFHVTISQSCAFLVFSYVVT